MNITGIRVNIYYTTSFLIVGSFKIAIQGGFTFMKNKTLGVFGLFLTKSSLSIDKLCPVARQRP